MTSGYFRCGLSRCRRLPCFVKLSRLQEILEQPGRANILAAPVGTDPAAFAGGIQSNWNLDDLQLSVSEVEGGTRQLVSSRVFFDDVIVESLESSVADSAPLLTYLANDIKSGDKATPYSMVTGVAPKLNGIVGSFPGRRRDYPLRLGC